MHESIARTLYYVGIHLLYASLVWLAAWVLTSIRRGSATTKYWIWVTTSLYFLLPLGAMIDSLWAPHLSWARPLPFVGAVGAGIAESATATTVLCAVWLLGAALVFARLCMRICADRRDAQSTVTQRALDAGPGLLAHGVPVRFAEGGRAPAVYGVLHPHICLPTGIDRLLSEQELNAVLVHELTHARRRDNLIRLVYEVGLCGLWFHPLVWMTGSRLALYRELSCDESVIQNSQGRDRVSALAKLANPEGAFLLQATASSFLSDRLAGLVAAQPQRKRRAASMALAVVFGAVFLWGILGTVAHTACCFLARS